MKSLFGLAVFLVFSWPASAAIEDGTITALGPNYIELRTSNGQVLRFTMAQKLLDGKPGRRIVYADRFQALRVGYDVRLNYWLDRNTMICEGIRITKRRGGI
jgi:hypothetical protein